MCEANPGAAGGEELAARVQALEGKLLSRTILIPVVTALIAVVGTLAGTWASFVGDERDREIQSREILKEDLQGLTQSYQVQRQKVLELALLHGVPRAIELERPFRSGATIRALEELRERASPEDRARIDASLDSVPKLLFIDSKARDNVYTERTRWSAGTNVDDIARIVRPYPVRVVGRIGDVEGPARLTQEIVSHRPPAVICMHLGAFEGIQDGRTDDEKVTSFLEGLRNAGVPSRVILYSRQGLPLLEKVTRSLGEDLSADIMLVPMQSTGIEEGSENWDLLERALTRAANLDRLYKRTLE
jgi:hypothetical protein